MKRKISVAELEARLGVALPASYRAYAAERSAYLVALKHVRLRAPAAIDWMDDAQTLLVIGDTGDGYPLVLKRGKRGVSSIVYELIEGRAVRRPEFAEFLHDKRPAAPIVLSDDPSTRYAERLAGTARRCACGAEIRIQQRCTCGCIGAVTDAVIPPVADPRFPHVWHAWRTIRSLVDGGTAVPSGPRAILRLAAGIEGGDLAAVISEWATGTMPVKLDRRRLRAAIDRVLAE